MANQPLDIEVDIEGELLIPAHNGLLLVIYSRG
jgi:hypothetical protein